MCKSQKHSVMLQYLKVTHPHMHNTKDHIINYADITEKHTPYTHRAFLENGEMKLIECKSLHLFHRFGVSHRATVHTQGNVCVHNMQYTPPPVRVPGVAFSPCTYFQQSYSLEYILRNLMTFSRLVNIIHLSHGYWYNFYKLFALHRFACIFFNLLFESINFASKIQK